MGYHTHMKTTLDIADTTLLRAKAMAKQTNRTLRSLVEEGLITVLERNESTEAIRVRPITFKGDGLSPEFSGKGWSEIRDASYQGHGA